MMRSLELLVWVLGALALTLQRGPPVVVQRARPVALPRLYEEGGVFDFTTVVCDRSGQKMSTSDPSAALPFNLTTGITRIGRGDNAWHVYTIVTADRVVQAAQRASSRRILAANAASRLLIPMGLLIVGIGALLAVSLRGGLKSLDSTSKDVAARSALLLEPIDAGEVPLEIQPLIGSINDLMQRLAEASSAQRRFVADAAHELRSPIAALRLQLRNLERSQDGTQRAQAIGELRLGIERSQGLIVQLLDLSRVEPDVPSATRKRLDLGSLAWAVIVEFHPEAMAKHVDLGADAPDELWIEGNVEEIQMLLRNLVANAVRHVSQGGRVDVSTRAEKGIAMLEIADNGPGIALAERARVFDRFFRGAAGLAAADVTGSGLGLAIARAVSERHGAELLLLSSDVVGGPGLRVQVRFPAL